MERIEVYEFLRINSFHTEYNANDFFAYATACSVSIREEDLDWVIPHIQKYGKNNGINSVLAYVQNLEPIKPFLTPGFEEAINDLIGRDQKVSGDKDFEFYGYIKEGKYRKIKED